MSERIDILNERELTALEQSSGDDCDMAAVKCVVRELRERRAADLTDEDRTAIAFARWALGCRGQYGAKREHDAAIAVLDKLAVRRHLQAK